MEENQGYVIRQSVLFDNGRGFALGEHPREGFVTWQFTQEGGHRDYYWGHYLSDPKLAEADYHNRAEDYQRRYHVQEVEQEQPKPGPYKYYSTQRPISVGTYPLSYFNKPIHMTVYAGREQVEGETFRAWGDLTYAQPLTEREMADYELRPSRDNPDVGKRMERQRATEHEEKKPSISQQMKEAGKLAQERQAPPAPKKNAPDRGER